MALTTVNITGTFNFPDASWTEYTQAEFMISGYDTDTDVVVPRVVKSTLGPLGELDVDLWGNDDGIRGTIYGVNIVIYSNVGLTREIKRIDLGRIQIQGDGPFNIANLLDSPVTVPEVWYMTITEAEYNAAIQAVADAEAAAAAAEVSETNAEQSAAAIQPYPDRATAEAANVPAPVVRIGYFSDPGPAVFFRRDALGTALTTGDGSNWSPDGEVTVMHFGAVVDKVADDTTAFINAISYVQSTQSHPQLYLGVGSMRITSRIPLIGEGVYIKGAGPGVVWNFKLPTEYIHGSEIFYDGPALADTEGVFFCGDYPNTGVASFGRNMTFENFMISCQDLGNAFHFYNANNCILRQITTNQAVWGVVTRGTNNNSMTFNRVKCYDPPTGGGGMDLRETSHSTLIEKCQFENKTTGTRNPSHGIRLAADGNCSNPQIFACNFDYYRVTVAHFSVETECRGFGFEGNYIECRNDGVTAGAVLIKAGKGGSIHNNRITNAANAIDYGVNIFAGVRGVSVTDNLFNNFDVACIRIPANSDIYTSGNIDDTGTTPIIDYEFVDDNYSGFNGKELMASGLSIGTPTEVTIVGGVLDVGGASYVSISTEAGAATDDVDTIIGSGVDGQILILQASITGQVPVLKQGTGNLRPGGADVSLSTGRDKAVFIFNKNTAGATGQWQMLAPPSFN